MNRELNGPRSRPDDLRDPHTANDALLRWDELDEQLLRMLSEDPERGWRLRKLQDADGWLRRRATEAARKAVGPALLICPPPEDLYDFGQGPGANLLTPERRASIDRHLATCLECERFVTTLSTAPPSPLVGGMPEEAPAPIERAAPTITVPRRRLRLVPVLATAAAVVVIFFGVRSLMTPAATSFPEGPLLRGAAGGPLLYPRERVLLPSAEVAALFPALNAPLRFEVEPQPEADSYRFDLFRHEGGAFGRDVKLEGAAVAANSFVARAPREAGRFTFEVWVTRRGLDQRLGARDFQIATDAALESDLLALRTAPESERTLQAVVLLHEAGYVADARELARTLPESPDRDRYLSQSPGR
ncbi:MAG: hypothetical protein JNL28_16515 [Planctomycetes bacterium]|nr:hypothetical protein [Planctomycetota bacterium]